MAAEQEGEVNDDLVNGVVAAAEAFVAAHEALQRTDSTKPDYYVKLKAKSRAWMDLEKALDRYKTGVRG